MMSKTHDAAKPDGPNNEPKAEALAIQISQAPADRSTFASVILILGCALSEICMLGGATVQIMLPSIEKTLQIPEAKLLWPFTAYSLTAGCFLLLLGRLADIYGRKRGFLLGMAWYAVWSIASGFAQSLVQLSIFRAFQGMGAAAVIPSTVGIIAQEFPPGRMRSIAFATFSCGGIIGGGVSTLVGGTVSQFTRPGWRSMFFIMCGLIAFAAAAVFFVVPADYRDANIDKRVDWIGAAIITVSLVFLLFVLAQGEVAPDGWKTGYIIALLILAVTGITVFIGWEYYLEERTTFPPLMSLRLWRRAQGKFAAMQLIAFSTYLAFMGWTYWAVLYYSDYLKLTPVKVMMKFIPLFCSGIACNIIVAMVVWRISGAILLIVGCTFTGIGCLLFALIDTKSSFWAFEFPSAIVIPAGAEFIFAAGSIFVAKIALPSEQSLAGGIFNTVIQVGGAVGFAITGVVADQVTQAYAQKLGVNFDPRNPEASPPPPAAQLKGYRAAFWTCVGFCMLSLLLVIILLRDIGMVGNHESPTIPLDEEKNERPGEERAGHSSASSTTETVVQPSP